MITTQLAVQLVILNNGVMTGIKSTIPSLQQPLELHDTVYPSSLTQMECTTINLIKNRTRIRGKILKLQYRIYRMHRMN